ncbi:hypothetical protein HDV03_001130 [Kappamyces sp. JEL0829]|nr:hypothetical protein HDV03_001130 [Kappamyces sp. JEL0829]
MPVWILYFVLGALWLVLFVFLELRAGTFTSRGLYMRIADGKKTVLGLPSDNLVLTKGRQKEPGLKTFSWKDIATAKKNGDLLVVAGSRYVYRITPWLRSHPGGQLILQSVAGTDITIDYFYESNFDHDAFSPQKDAPARGNARRSESGDLRQRRVPRDSTATMILRDPSSIPAAQAAERRSLDLGAIDYQVNDEEWALVLRARRTHVHTRLAMERLTSFICGRLATKEPYDFDPDEPRRYAMVRIDLDSASEIGSVYRIKFALLYPFDKRAGEPDRFWPGQSIRISWHSDGQVHSTYYSPISGNLKAFEVLVKSNPNGQVSKLLTSHEPGHRQYQISGPFGAPIVFFDSPNSPITSFDEVIYLTAGSGVVSALAMLSTLILPTNASVLVSQSYLAAAPDEISINAGDLIRVQHHYGDGWAYGFNYSTSKTGVFPLGSTTYATTRITVLNTCQTRNDIIGKNVFEAALLAHPEFLSIQHIVTREPKTIQEQTPYGSVGSGRMTKEVVKDLFRRTWEPVELRQLVVVCGPVSFTSMVVDTLEETLSINPHQMRILESEKE